MKTLIVPTDFSSASVNALNYALALAKEINARIILFHAYQIPVTFSEVPVVTISLEELQRETDAKMEQLLQDARHVSSGVLDISIENVLGNTVEELGELCRKYAPFAVVMGTKGAGALERMIIGSTTLDAIKELTVPVLIVPPGAVYKSIHKIGFACDFRDVKETIPANAILEFIAAFKASLHILNVDFKEKHFSGETPLETEEIHELLGAVNPSYHYINSTQVDEGINAFSDANRIDLLITVPKKHSFWESIFRKSQSSELVLHSHLPIVAMHH